MKITQPKIEMVEQQLCALEAMDAAVLGLFAAEDIRTAWDLLSLKDHRRVVRALVTPVVSPESISGQTSQVEECVRLDGH